MKTLIKSLALALSLGFVTSAATFAETNPIGRPTSAASFKTGIYSTVTGTLRVSVDKETGGKVDVRLKNADGKTLYTQHLSKNDRNCRLLLNLNDLEDGVYQLEITNGVETTTQNVTLLTKLPSTPNRIVSIN
ncbi:hypothetical protein [Spirosoma validum]|uniref:Secretion system C-terminal sorting domain-containing protein n=1 Tax=Spirosoma validum TaxID=2771355 RepID=A0A927B416_9BACT|nr:hypothetical protein [Spirosoma validum]MBD2755010.1 hypothetical protein [Spirosoma validum]